jgi:hypothetical protein
MLNSYRPLFPLPSQMIAFVELWRYPYPTDSRNFFTASGGLRGIFPTHAGFRGDEPVTINCSEKIHLILVNLVMLAERQGCREEGFEEDTAVFLSSQAAPFICPCSCRG